MPVGTRPSAFAILIISQVRHPSFLQVFLRVADDTGVDADPNQEKFQAKMEELTEGKALMIDNMMQFETIHWNLRCFLSAKTLPLRVV